MVVRSLRLLNNDGSEVKATVIAGVQDFILKYDTYLAQSGIITDAGGILIDQGATSEHLNSYYSAEDLRAGQLPDYYMGSPGMMPGDIIVGAVNHFGWQRYVALIDNGRFVYLPGDHRLEDFGSWMVQDSDGVWQIVDQLKLGMPQRFLYGWSGPVIVRDGRVVDLKQILGNPRLRADARNLFVFNDGHVPGEFFQLIRPLLPTDEADLAKLLEGRLVTVRRREALSHEDFHDLAKIIIHTEQHHLQLHQDGEYQSLTFTGQRPRMRMPLTGVGFDANNQLLVVAVDGRQPDSVGATIEELAQILVDHGAIYATLGGGGGDVIVGQLQEDGQVRYLNTPSNKFPDGRFGAPRPVPNALIIGA